MSQAKINIRSLFLITLLGSIVLAGALYPQSKAAKKWYDKGEKAGKSTEKVTYFKKAISLDPSFTEAYYKLGLVYQKDNKLNDAMKYLGRALFSRPSNLENSLRLKIVFEIGKIQFKLKSYHESKKSFLGALNLTESESQRIAVLQELSEVLIADEAYDDAVTRLKQAIQLDPKNKIRYEQRIKQTRQLKDIDQIYQAGAQFVKSRQFKKAIAKFEKVLTLDASFKDTQDQLTAAHKELATIQQREKAYHSSLIDPPSRSSSREMASKITSYRENSPGANRDAENLEESIFAKGMEQVKNKEWEAALKSFESVLSMNPQNSEAAEQKKLVLAAFEKSMQERLVSRYYNQGVKYLRRKKWVQAIIAFEKVLTLNSRHSAAKRSLQRAQTGLEERGSQTAKQHYYDQGMQAIEDEDWILAESIFGKLMKLDEDYLDTRAHKQIVTENVARLNKNADLLKQYQAGEYFFRRGKWQEAVQAFEKVTAQNANFHDVQLQLQFARERFEKSNQSTHKPSVPLTSLSFINYLGIGAVLLLIIPVLVLFFNRGVRGRVYIFLGQQDRAVKLYENLVDNGSMSDRLCLSLLHLFIIENRQDALAIKIFERALRLHLLVDKNRQDEVSAIVTRYYLGTWEKEVQQIDQKIELLERSESEIKPANDSPEQRE